MKTKLLTALWLSISLVSCLNKTQECDVRISDNSQSNVLFDNCNKQRLKNNLNVVYHDTILDNICKVLLLQNMKKNNTYNVDSIHLLFYKNGIIDYQFEIIEFTDNKMLESFRNFILSDNFPFLQVGYARNSNQHIILKTKKYLKFHHGEGSTHSTEIDPLKTKSNQQFTFKNDIVKYYLQRMIIVDYYYSFSKKIPSKKNDDILDIRNYGKIVNNIRDNYDIVFTAKDKETQKFLIVQNSFNEIVAILK